MSDLEAAWNKVTGSDPTNWMILGFEGKTLKVTATGNGGLTEFRDEICKDPEAIFFGGFQVVGVDEQQNVTSKRPKFVRVTYMGSNVKPMVRSRVLQHQSTVDRTFNGIHAHLQISDAADLTLKSVGKNLLASGGAHKPTHYDFGGGETIPLTDLD